MSPDQAAEILEVSTNISKDELKKKFKRLVMKYHPDRNKDHDSTKKFIEIKEAYEILFKYDPNPYILYPGDIITMGQGFNLFSPVGTMTFTFH